MSACPLGGYKCNAVATNASFSVSVQVSCLRLKLSATQLQQQLLTIRPVLDPSCGTHLERIGMHWREDSNFGHAFVLRILRLNNGRARVTTKENIAQLSACLVFVIAIDARDHGA